MPTEKPRVTITMSQEQLDRVDDFRFSHKMKNQTQAILSLIESGLAGSGQKNAPSLPDEAIKIARDYEKLDEHGKRVVQTLLREEQARLTEANKEEPPAKIEYIRHYLTAAAAGYAAPIEGEDYELIPRDKSVPVKADFCIDIDGDSMEPYIHSGQRVYVQRDTELREFDVGIFFVDGDVFCKQWCIDYAGTLHLLSANPKREDANIAVHRDSVRNVVCFGKVLLPHKLPRPQYR